MIKTILLVGIGGGLGSILRYMSTLLTDKLFQTDFPIGTFIVNIAGCFITGLLIGLFESHILNNETKSLLITGFCGGFTTFSAFSAETLKLFECGNVTLGFVYITTSILIGLFAVLGGYILIK